ncbi:hypothetical protein [Clostridium lundense]|uniref:hypothetical protein n=1 Tax=Clostridium lundense TaxID=319475 RepID=UPI000A6F6578|nr:hypothetical protein [Clostridium lundense]
MNPNVKYNNVRLIQKKLIEKGYSIGRWNCREEDFGEDNAIANGMERSVENTPFLVIK